MANKEVIKYQVQELQMRKGWSQPYFNQYGIATYDTRKEAVEAMSKFIKAMNGREKRFNGWSHLYKPTDCYQVMSIKSYEDIKEDIKSKAEYSLEDVSISDLIDLKEAIDKRIKELEFTKELKALLDRADKCGLREELLESIK